MSGARIDHALIRTPVAWPLRIMVAIIVFIAGAGLLSAWALSLSAQQLDQGLRGQLTIELPPEAPGKKDAAALTTLVKAVSAIKGVTAVQPMTPAQTADLLRPWLGAEALQPENMALLPVPQLITVEAATPEAVEAVRTQLKLLRPEAILADHQQWVQQLAHRARQAAFGLLTLVAVLLLGLFSTVAFACRAGLNVQLPTVTLLHIIGATDEHICRQMQHYAWRLVWPGCLLGALVCAVVSYGLVALLESLTPGQSVMVVTRFWWGAAGLGVLLPLLVWFFARLSARLTTQRALQAMT